MKKDKSKEYYDYICPKCLTKISVEKGKKLSSMYCRNCLKEKQLNMLRLIYPSK